jgi:hypothetical protein
LGFHAGTKALSQEMYFIHFALCFSSPCGRHLTREGLQTPSFRLGNNPLSLIVATVLLLAQSGCLITVFGRDLERCFDWPIFWAHLLIFSFSINVVIFFEKLFIT